MIKRFPIFCFFDLVFSGILLSLVFVFSFSISYTFSQIFAESPAFDESLVSDVEIINQRSDWIQTYGSASTGLGSDYVDILAVNYVSDGKALNTTFWLGSNSENASLYSQPDKSV